MITQAQLKELLDYDAETGNLSWAVPRRRNSISAGTVAGYVDLAGSRKIDIHKRRYLAAKLIWLWHHGEYPESIIFLNRDRADTRIENLRRASHSAAQARNRLPNRLGLKGVYAHGKKFGAQIGMSGTRIAHLGLFSTPEEAHEAFKKAHVQRHGENSEYFKEAA